MFQGIRRANNSLLSKEPELDNLVSEEKDVLRALKTLQKESDEAGNHILKWCEKEKDDLKDIFDYLGGLDAEFAQVIGNMANRHTIYRQKLKEVKILQEVVVNLTKKHAASAAQGAASLIETSDLKEQLRAAEFSFECQKRNLIREGVKQKYQGWAETASKLGIMAQYGKRMAAEIPTLNLQAGQQLPVYQGYPSTKSIHNDYITTSMNLVDMKTVECSISGLRIESNVPPVPTQVPASIPTPPISVPQSDGSSKGLAGSVDLKSIPDAPLDEKPALPERTLTPAGIASHYHSLASSPLAAYVDAKTIESTNLNTTEKFHSEQLNSNQTSTATYKDIQPVDTRIPPHGIKTEAPSVIQASFPGPYAQPGPVQNTSHFHHSIIQPSHSIDYQQQNFVPSTSVPQYQHAVAPSQQPKPYSGPIQSGYYQQMPYQQTGYQQGGIAQQHPPRPSTHAPNYSNNIYPQQKPSGNAQPHYQGYQQTSAGFPPQAAQTGYQISNSNLQQTSVSNSPYYNRPMQHSHQIQRPPASTTYGQRPSHINQRPTLEYQQQRPPPGVPVNPAVQHPTSGKNENRYSVPKLHDYI